MATIRKRSGGWRAEVCRLGVRASKTFATKAEAQTWATMREAEILEQGGGRPEFLNSHTLHDALARYAETVSTTKKGERWERVRLAAFAKQMDFVGQLIQDIKAPDIARWRDERLKKVSGSSVSRDMALLSAVFSKAVKEWRWCAANPVSQVSRPRKANPRDRRVYPHEADAILEQLKYQGGRPETLSQELAVAFLLAIETAMRQGEILSLDWSRIYLAERYLVLDDTKNGHARSVPLSNKAAELLERMGASRRGPVFRLKSGSADTLFRRARNAAGLHDLNFHDTRHEATTRLAAKLDVLELARVTGHKDLRQLMVYYNPTASELAERLN